MKINMAHGGGGTMTQNLIDGLFKKHFRNDLLMKGEDSAVLELSGRTAFTTDSFVVQPLLFPGGDIGKLAVCGTVNDLLTVGAAPRYLSAAFIIEEGMELDTLEAIVQSMAKTANEAGVSIVTGDTKVIEGHGGLLINTSGIGSIRDGYALLPCRDGDALLLSGNLGEHHAAILSQRMGIENNIKSDCAPLGDMVMKLLDAGIMVKSMRDVTRGGLGTILSELAALHGMGIELIESLLPVSAEVKGFCGILGLDPLYMGNEGKMAFIVDKSDTDAALDIIRSSRYGENAALIGHVANGKGVAMRTGIGGIRMISPLAGEGLPRIC